MLNAVTVGDRIWTVDGPELVFAGAPMHTRMTVVHLEDGTLWIHSPIALTEDVTGFIDGLGGAVCAIVAPNKFHHLWVAQWRERFPEAHVFAEADLKKKVAALADTENITNEAPALYGRDIEQLIFAGNRLFQEAVFFHKPSRTLIFTDLMINLRADGAPRLARWFLEFEGVTFPNGGVPRLYRWLTSDKDTARACVQQLLAWSPRQLIFSHGEPFTDDPEAVLRREFGYLWGQSQVPE